MAAISTPPRVRVLAKASAAPVPNSIFGKSTGTRLTTRVEFDDPVHPEWRHPQYHVAISLTTPSCCGRGYFELEVVDVHDRTRNVWINTNSFTKRFATSQGYPLLKRLRPTAAHKIPPALIYPAFAPRVAAPKKEKRVAPASAPAKVAVELTPASVSQPSARVSPPPALVAEELISIPPPVQAALSSHRIRESDQHQIYAAFLKAVAHHVELTWLDRRTSSLARDVIVLDRTGYLLLDAADQGDPLVGKGSFKHVYHAVDLRNGDPYVVGECDISHPVREELCQREFRFNQQLTKVAHIAKMTLFTVKNKTGYFIAPLYAGGTLFDKLDPSQSYIPTLQLLNWFKMIFEGVSNMHREGILHRDLKLENIFFNATGNPFIADLGFACSEVDLGRWGIYRRCGTPAYLAPELLTQPFPKWTTACDIWALGVMLHMSIVDTQLPWLDKLKDIPPNSPPETYRTTILPWVPKDFTWTPPFPSENILESEFEALEQPLRKLITNMLAVDPLARIKDPFSELRRILDLIPA